MQLRYLSYDAIVPVHSCAIDTLTVYWHIDAATNNETIWVNIDFNGELCIRLTWNQVESYVSS